MARAEREPITGGWGRSPQRGSRSRSSPWSGGQGAKPPEAKSILISLCPNLVPLRAVLKVLRTLTIPVAKFSLSSSQVSQESARPVLQRDRATRLSVEILQLQNISFQY